MKTLAVDFDIFAIFFGRTSVNYVALEEIFDEDKIYLCREMRLAQKLVSQKKVILSMYY